MSKGGSDSDHGIEYEKRLSMALVIQGLRSKYKDFAVKRQEEEAGKFDDVVFRYEENGKIKFKLIQAKHQLEPKSITFGSLLAEKGDFSMKVYINSFSKIKKNNLFQNSALEDIECVIFTNRFLSNDKKDGRSLMNFLKELKNQDEILDLCASIYLEKNESKIYKIKSNEIDNMTDIILKKHSLCDQDVKEFLKSLVFAVNQPTEEQLRVIIMSKIIEEINDKEIATDLYSRLYEEVGKWVATNKRIYLGQRWAEELFSRGKDLIGGIEFMLQSPVENFTGRKEILEELMIKFESKSEQEKTVISQSKVITGLGGIGKSELARKFALRYKSKYTDWIWINANETNIKTSFSNLAKSLLISEEDIDAQTKNIKTIVDNVYSFFTRNNSRRPLFIFDDTDSYKSIKDYLPNTCKNIHVLITSRNQKWGKIEVIQLDSFSEEEALEFIKKELGENICNGTHQLADMLQNFPLALQQAVAYIKEKDIQLQNIGSKFEIGDYILRFETETKNLLSYEFPEESDEKYTKTTFTTWKITVDTIKDNTECGQRAIEILNIVSYFSSHFMSTVLKKEHEDLEYLCRALDILIKYSMISKGKMKKCFRIHCLVQQVTRIHLKENNKEEEMLHLGINLISTNVYSFDLHNVISFYFHVLQNISLLREFCDVIFCIFQDLGRCNILYKIRTEDALKDYIFMMKYLQENNIDQESYQLYKLIYMNKKLANLYNLFQNFDMSQKLLETAIEMLKISGKTDKFTLKLQIEINGNLGLTLMEKEQFVDAQRIQEENLKKCLDTFNEDDKLILKLQMELIEGLRKQGKFDEAIDLNKMALDSCSEHYNQTKLELLGSLAFILEEKGEYTEYAECVNKYIEELERMISHDYPNISIPKNILQEFDEKSPKYYKDAFMYCKEALDVSLKSYSQNSNVSVEDAHKKIVKDLKKKINSENNIHNNIDNAYPLLLMALQQDKSFWDRVEKFKEGVVNFAECTKKGEHESANNSYLLLGQIFEDIIGTENSETVKLTEETHELKS